MLPTANGPKLILDGDTVITGPALTVSLCVLSLLPVKLVVPL